MLQEMNMSIKKVNKRGHLKCGKTQIYLPKNDNTTAHLKLQILNDSCRFWTIKILLVRPYSVRSKLLLKKPKIILGLHYIILNPGEIFQVPHIVVRENQALIAICRSKKDVTYNITGEEHV